LMRYQWATPHLKWATRCRADRFFSALSVWLCNFYGSSSFWSKSNFRDVPKLGSD